MNRLKKWWESGKMKNMTAKDILQSMVFITVADMVAIVIILSIKPYDTFTVMAVYVMCLLTVLSELVSYRHLIKKILSQDEGIPLDDREVLYS